MRSCKKKTRIREIVNEASRSLFEVEVDGVQFDVKELDNGSILFWRKHTSGRGGYLIIPRELLIRAIEATHPKDPIDQLIQEWPAVNKTSSLVQKR